jgi:zinc transport system permease protein
MAVLAALAGALAAPLGLAAAYATDAPAGPCIVLAAGAIFAVSALGSQLWQVFARRN